jgi:hypothetical protein
MRAGGGVMMIRSMCRVCKTTRVHMSGPRKQMEMDKIRFPQ